MTDEQLRNELTRIAEAAPEIDVPTDLFARGRRATTRARVLIAAAAVACLALIAGITIPLPAADEAEVVDSDGLAIPDHIYAPPSHLTDLEEDLDIGTAAAAFVTEALIPVVIEADSGAYHLLHLDGFTQDDSFDTPTGLALSPDGNRLAWAFADQVTMGQRPSGIRIADLRTGDIREVRIESDVAGTLVSRLAWSRNSAWLAWAGTPMRKWSNQTISPTTRFIGGVIGNGTESSQLLPGADAHDVVRGDTLVAGGNPTSEIAVSDDGRLAAVVGRTLQYDGDRQKVEQRDLWFFSAIWFDDDRLRGIEFSTTGEHAPVVRSLPSGQATPTDSTLVQPELFGALGQYGVLVGSTANDEDDPTAEVQLWTWTTRGRVNATGTLIRLQDGVLGLTLASDLLDPADPQVVPRPEPDWPWSTERWLWTIGGGAANIGLVVYLILVVNRARARAVRR